MQALDWTRPITTDDGMEALAPFPAVKWPEAVCRAAGPLGWLASGVMLAIAVRLAGAAGESALLALGGTAALLYLGTAALAARPLAILLDLAAATSAVTLAVQGQAHAALLTHVLWGLLRGSLRDAPPGRRFANGWAALNASAAMLLALSH